MSVLVAARTLGELSAWQLTNLQIQKVLYIAQMLHLGRTGAPLFPERFEAWELGPVVPKLYRELKGFRSNVVAAVNAPSIFAFGTSQAFAIDDAFVMTQHMSAGQLVNFTHRIGGAWEAHFRQGEKGCTIPTDAILAEWEACVRPSAETMDWAEQMAAEVEARPSQYLDDQDERVFRARLRLDN